jgi:hypothetical protein
MPDIINAIVTHFVPYVEKIMRLKNTEKLSRQIAIYLCPVYCNNRISFIDIGETLFYFSVFPCLNEI